MMEAEQEEAHRTLFLLSPFPFHVKVIGWLAEVGLNVCESVSGR